MLAREKIVEGWDQRR